jgi:hypothetical protein
MTRPHKHPETAALLREKYGDAVVEIIDFSESAVAEALKNSKVFVWRGDDQEGSPRPPKEALVAGCVVVGLESDLREEYQTDFGVRCSTVDELIRMAGECRKMPMPSQEQRSIVRDSSDEKEDWLALLSELGQENYLRARVESEASSHLNSGDVDLLASLRRAEWTSKLLAAEAVEKDRIILEGYQQQRQLDPLIALVAERQRAVESLAEQLAERHEKVLALTEHVAERQRAVELLTSQLADTQEKLAECIASCGEFRPEANSES